MPLMRNHPFLFVAGAFLLAAAAVCQAKDGSTKQTARVAKVAARNSSDSLSTAAAPEKTEGESEGDEAAEAQRGGASRPSADPAIELTAPRTYQLKMVVRVTAPKETACKNVAVVAPIPMDWHEQKVRLLSRKFTEGGKYREQIKRGQCATMKFQIPRIEAGESASVELLYEITRWRMQFTLPGDTLEFAKGPPADVRDQYSRQPPGLEMKHPKIVKLADELEKQHAADGPWEMVKGFWQWTRDNVEFENGDFRGALFALEQHCGDCEEMSALFVSMCRLSGVVARSVWVEGHNYPEFYLRDSHGKGHWIPAQVLGPAWFGEMTEYRPIFQKGDAFYDPFKRKYVRYTPQTARADGNSSEPKLTVEHLILADSDINGPTYENSK